MSPVTGAVGPRTAEACGDVPRVIHGSPQFSAQPRKYFVHNQRDGLFYVGFTPTDGQVTGETLSKIADLADQYGSGRICSTAQQQIVILDVPDPSVDDLLAELNDLELAATADEELS